MIKVPEINLQCICEHCNRSKRVQLKDTPRDLLCSSKCIAKYEKLVIYYNHESSQQLTAGN